MAANSENQKNEGWVNYQELVLNELKRNTIKLDILEKEVVDLKMSNARLEVDRNNADTTLHEILTELKNIESRIDTKVKELNTAREQMVAEINLVKWKIGVAASTGSTIIVFVLQALLKLFLPL